MSKEREAPARSALKLALEALESCMGLPHWPALVPTITAIREALMSVPDGAEQPAQDQSQPCPNCESLSKQVTALKTCLEVERGFREQEQPVISGKWAWVPVDPSWAMLIAGNHGQPGNFSAKKVWGDMIAALERSFDYRRPDDPPKTSPQPAQPSCARETSIGRRTHD